MSNGKQVPIIDLFAGPGGLGEGFTPIVDKKNKRHFKIVLSIEKDEFAHQTLTLRSFLRQFPFKRLPSEYYKFLKGEIIFSEDLYKLYPEEAGRAKEEAWKAELGKKTPHSVIDGRIKQALSGESQFVLIGGPPCQAYSLVGRARRQEKEGLNREDERVYLYREYYRILAVHNPPVFVMENVKGLLSSKVDDISIFNQILNDLRHPLDSYKKLNGKEGLPTNTTGYRIYSLVKPAPADSWKEDIFEPQDFVIKSEKYGIPQARHRVILLGVRNDIKVRPGILEKTLNQISIEDVLDGLPRLRSGLSKSKDGKEEWKKCLFGILKSNIADEIDKDVWYTMEKSVRSLQIPQKDRGSNYLMANVKTRYKSDWYLDPLLKGVINHETRSHIKSDIYRYLFASCFASVHKHSPKLSDFPQSLLPNHLNIVKGIEENKFADRFRVQLAKQPSKTITSHISKDGHYYIHPDPRQCRSLTVREAARIQTFPDNYYFCGPRTSQYHQVGNAVPPFLAYQIAQVVQGILS